MTTNSTLSGHEAWIARINWLMRVFSIKDLLKTLFSPWHRDRSQNDTDLSWWEKIIMNTFVRLLGAIFRLFIIVPGLLLILVTILAWPAYVVLRIKVDEAKLRSAKAFGRDLAFGFTPHLKKYARELGHDGDIVMVGKDEALTRLERVLAKPNQNNVLLVAEPGSGRTTLIDHLAYRLMNGLSYENLNYRHVWNLETESLSGQELKNIVVEAANAGNIILVIDNFHTYPELPDILLPYLDVSSLQIIAVTDSQNYHSRLKQRADLFKAMEKVELQSPSDSDMVTLLQAIVNDSDIQVENDRVLAEIVRVTNQFEPHRSQPQKALDLLSEIMVNTEEVISLEQVYQVESQRTGQTIGTASTKERKTLLNLEELLNQHIVGQGRAVSAISAALRRSRSGVGDERKAMGSFLFLGQTGVGKTHTAKILAKVYFEEQAPLLRIDMSEFRDINSITLFQDRVAQMIEEHPQTVALFDEVEKAHSDVLNLFLQILDEGFITSSAGRKSYFNKAIIIATSNAGSDVLLDNPNLDKNTLINHIIGQGVFRPEFINRFDEVVAFQPLTGNKATEVARIMLDDLAELVHQQKGIEVSFDPTLIDQLSKLSVNSKFGARSIRRALQSSVEDYLAKEILEKDLQSGAQVLIPASALDKNQGN